MNSTLMQELRIGDLIATIPIIQGGMGIGISLSGLASAVADQGGVGVISAAGIGMQEADFYSNYLEANTKALRDEIRKAKNNTSGILGVNIMVAMSNFETMVKSSIEEGIDIIFSGAGLPLNLPKYLNETSKTKLVPIVSSGRAARIISKSWIDKYNYIPDAIVIEGPKAGGHLGFKLEELNDPEYSLENILKDVLKELLPFEEKYGQPIPVIAGGGVYTGDDIYKIMLLGAAGVQMATRFVTTIECDASVEFKNSYINATKEDIGIINSPLGMPGRAIINQYILDTKEGKKQPYKCPYHCITTCDYLNSPYCITLALMNAKKGLMKHGFAFAGENAYRAEVIISVQELIATLKDEYAKAANLA